MIPAVGNPLVVVQYAIPFVYSSYIEGSERVAVLRRERLGREMYSVDVP